MGQVIKNPLDPSCHNELAEILALLFDDFKERQDKVIPRVLPDWEDNIGRERLMQIFEEGKNINTASDGFRAEAVGKSEMLKDCRIKIFDILSRAYEEKRIIKRNKGAYYEPTNYMGWHTNFKQPSTRVYLIYSSGQSFFRYYDKENDEIITDYDDEGLTIRQFDITKIDSLWHCVGCRSGNRLSLGYMAK
jgi:hypothetical protein